MENDTLKMFSKVFRQKSFQNTITIIKLRELFQTNDNKSLGTQFLKVGLKNLFSLSRFKVFSNFFCNGTPLWEKLQLLPKLDEKFCLICDKAGSFLFYQI